MAEADNSLEPLKRAIAATTRALSQNHALIVSFGGDESGISVEGEARLPQPPGEYEPVALGRVRGTADALAMRLRHHDNAVHARRRPLGDIAQAIYDSVEQARVESLGMRRFKGVSDNVAAMLDARCRLRGYGDIDDFSDVPLHEAIGFMVRESITGMTPPEDARKMVDLCRSWIEEKAGDAFDSLGRDADDQGR